jgi:DNA-binding NtrC family response regulator
VSDRLRILVLEEDTPTRLSVSSFLGSGGDRVSASNHAHDVDWSAYDLCLGDARIVGEDGARVLPQCREHNVALVVTAPFVAPETVAVALRRGVYDVALKPLEPALMISLANRVRERKSLQRKVRALQEAIAARDALAGIAAGGPAMASVLRACRRAAASDAPVMVHGEASTGKRLVAQSIHGFSERAGAPMVTIDCARDAARLEAELLAPGPSAGPAIRAALGGSVLLARVDALPPHLHGPLFHVLSAMQGRVRVISTARALPPSRSRREQRGRPDLFRYLRGIEVHTPALRERVEDIPRLAEHLLATSVAANDGAVRVSPEVVTALMHARWEGNLAEFEAVLRVAAENAQGDDRVGLEHLPAEYRALVEGGNTLTEQVEAYEAAVLRQALDFVDGQVGRAAALLGVPERTLRRKMRHFDIAKETYRRRQRGVITGAVESFVPRAVNA